MTKKDFLTTIKDAVKKQKEIVRHYDFPDDDFNLRTELTKYKDDVLKIRGVKGVAIEEGGWSNSLHIIFKPCKEFVQLQKYLADKCKVTLNENMVRRMDVSGKRGLYDVEDISSLSNMPGQCKSLLQRLRETKASTAHHVTSERHSYKYYGDRFNSYGEDRESEWDGYFEDNLDLTFYTPTGRIRSTLRLSI